jgi:hypothetical protein
VQPLGDDEGADLPLPGSLERLSDAVDGMASSCAQRKQFLDELLFGGALDLALDLERPLQDLLLSVQRRSRLG